MTSNRLLLTAWGLMLGLVMIGWGFKFLLEGPGLRVDPTWFDLSVDVIGLFLTGLTLIVLTLTRA